RLVGGCVLGARVDGEFARGLQPVGGEPRGVEVGKPVAVEPFFDAGDTLIVDIDVADDMGHERTVWIHALVFLHETKSGEAEAVDFAALARRYLALEPYEAA